MIDTTQYYTKQQLWLDCPLDGNLEPQVCLDDDDDETVSIGTVSVGNEDSFVD